MPAAPAGPSPRAPSACSPDTLRRPPPPAPLPVPAPRLGSTELLLPPPSPSSSAATSTTSSSSSSPSTTCTAAYAAGAADRDGAGATLPTAAAELAPALPAAAELPPPPCHAYPASNDEAGGGRGGGTAADGAFEAAAARQMRPISSWIDATCFTAMVVLLKMTSHDRQYHRPPSRRSSTVLAARPTHTGWPAAAACNSALAAAAASPAAAVSGSRPNWPGLRQAGAPHTPLLLPPSPSAVAAGRSCGWKAGGVGALSAAAAITDLNGATPLAGRIMDAGGGGSASKTRGAAGTAAAAAADVIDADGLAAAAAAAKARAAPPTDRGESSENSSSLSMCLNVRGGPSVAGPLAHPRTTQRTHAGSITSTKRAAALGAPSHVRLQRIKVGERGAALGASKQAWGCWGRIRCRRRCRRRARPIASSCGCTGRQCPTLPPRCRQWRRCVGALLCWRRRATRALCRNRCWRGRGR